MESLPIEETPSTFEDYSIMCNLPHEILSYIFAFLQIEDRKRVRLVCKLWCDCSNCPELTLKEKLVFRIPFIDDISKVMRESKFSVLNLEFQCVPLNSLPLDVWEKCGSRIQSLEFHQCQWEDETIERVIKHCKNLISLTFRTEFKYLSSGDEILCSPQLLDKIVEEGVERSKLLTFIALINDPSIEIIANKIFLVYPRIKHFAARTISHNLISQLPISLESLEFTRAPSGAFIYDDAQDLIVIEACIAKAEQGLSLKHFNGIYDNMNLSSTKETLLNFFSCQKNLNAIKLKLHGDDVFADAAYNKEIFFHILKSCPSLQEFYLALFTPSSHLILEWKECPQFLTSISKLQSLRLHVCVHSDSASLTSKSHLPSFLTPSKNLVLTKLELHSREKPLSTNGRDHLCAALLQHCPLLLHLKLNCPSDNTLQIIFNHLLKLQTLILCYDCSLDVSCGNNIEFTGHDASRVEGYPIKHLQQLKHLSILGNNDCIRMKKILTGRTMLEIQLPHLEYLELNMIFLSFLEEESICNLAFQIPKLKVLSLSRRYVFCNKKTVSDVFCKMVQFCKYLKNLHRIHLVNLEISGFVDNNKSLIIEEVFRVCPSLRYVLDGSRMFFFDPLTDSKIVQSRKFDKNKVCEFKFKRNVFHYER